MGQRIVKIVKPHKKSGSVAVLAPQSEWAYTFYQLDATGNVLATYRREYELVSGTTYKSKYGLEEQYIYGSSRLGSIEQNQPDFESTFTATMTTTGADDDDEYFVLTSGFSSNAYAVNPGTSGVYEEYDHKTGWRHYEQVNHLGNVMSVISDRKVPVDRYNFINTGGSYTHGLSNVMGTYVTGATTLTHKISTGTDGTADGWMAEVHSYSDYYGFGALMPGRNTNANLYRYSVNGQEDVDEISGVGNHTTAEYWEYDTRLGRRWNIDPKTVPYESPYAVFRNNPVMLADPLGDCPDCKTLYTNTASSESFLGIIKNGFNATKFGKYSNYNWFSTVENAVGTGREGQGVTLAIEGIDVSNAHIITKAQTTAWRLEAMSELGYTKESLIELQKLDPKAYGEAMSKIRGTMYGKVGAYMDDLGKALYFLEKDGTYALSDKLANKGVITSARGSKSIARTINGLKIGGRILTAVAVGLDVYEIYNSGFHPRVITRVAGGWAGAIVGAKIGSAAGAAIGVWFFGAGAVPGYLIGGIAGGIGGYFAGREMAEVIYDVVTNKGVPVGGK